MFHWVLSVGNKCSPETEWRGSDIHLHLNILQRFIFCEVNLFRDYNLLTPINQEETEIEAHELNCDQLGVLMYSENWKRLNK